MSVTGPISAVSEFAASAGHGTSYLPSARPFQGSIIISHSPEKCFDIVAEVIAYGGGAGIYRLVRAAGGAGGAGQANSNQLRCKPVSTYPDRGQKDRNRQCPSRSFGGIVRETPLIEVIIDDASRSDESNGLQQIAVSRS